MMDPRITKLAKTILTYSVSLQPKQHIMIEVRGEGDLLAKELVKEAYAIGAYPHVRFVHPEINREILTGNSAERVTFIKKWEEEMWKDFSAFVVINGPQNENELSDVSMDTRMMERKVMRPIKDYILNNLNWTLINYPTYGMAQNAKMSTAAFTDFYFDVCAVDYQKMGEAFKPLQERMNRTDQVRLVGPGTDLTFSIKDIPSVICAGDSNIPDGEIYTAPVRDSVNGTITYNAPSTYHDIRFENVRLTFQDGKIIEATANDTDRLNEIFDTDEGARYIGEFAIAANPYILHPMGDILFDEKIAGSFHFTPGQAFETADNGNRSAVHWDLVNIQRPEYGGGEIYFDGVLIRKDGLFVLDELKGLNPENLK